MANKPKWYVIFEGRKKGIFTSWDECKTSIDGYSGAKYKSFLSRAEAEKAFKDGYSFSSALQKNLQPRLPFASNSKPILPSIAVDAACAGVPGPVEYQGVIIETGDKIFQRGPLPNGTNNIGEFLAIVLGLAWLSKKNLDWVLYSDSKTAISWVLKKKCLTKHEFDQTNSEILAHIEAAEKWLNENVVKNKIRKWETEIWGENPADFGRK